MASEQLHLRSEKEPAQRIAFLDGVRGLAATLVVLHHLLAAHYPAYQRWSELNIDLGRVGVVTFFLVSGYVIPLSLRSQSLRTFAVRRLFRLYPVYWVALALLVILDTERMHGQSPAVIGLNILMLHGLIGAVSILPVAWTLSIELLFYAQAATAKALGLLDRSVHAGWGWLALYMLMSIAERVTGRDLPVTLPMLLFTAALGQATYLRDNADDRTWVALAGAGALLVPAGAYLGMDAGEWQPFTYATSFLAGLAVFGYFYARRLMPSGRGWVGLGAVSYSLYLFHGLFVEGTFFEWSATGTFTAKMATIPLVAYLSWRLIERPSQNFGRSLTTATRPSPAAPAHSS